MPVGEIYFPLTVGFPSNRKVRTLVQFGSPDAGLARDLYVQMLIFCKDTMSDGHVPEHQLGLLVYPTAIEHAKQLASHLVSVELINEEPGGWFVPGFLRKNKTRAEIKALSEVRAESGRNGGSVSRPKPKTARQTGRKASVKQVGSDVVSNRAAITPPKTETYTETNKDLSRAASGTTGEPNVGDVVAAYVDGARSGGQPDPASSLRARVGKQARQLLAEGIEASTLIDSARSMGRGQWNDLAVQVRKDAAERNGNGHHSADTTQMSFTDEEYASGW